MAEETAIENVESVETEQVDTQEPAEQQEEMIPKSQMEQIIKDRVAREKKAAEKAVEEAKRLAQMNQAEKQQYEFEQLQQELAEYKRKDALNGLSKEASKTLAEHDIQSDDDLLAFVVKDTAEDTQTAVNAFVNLINTKVQDGVKKALSGQAPKVNTQPETGITKERFNKMTYPQKLELYNTNKELYDQLNQI